MEPQDSIAYTAGSSLSVTLHCQPQASSSSINWYKDGDIIMQSAGLLTYTLLDNGSLVLLTSNGTSLEGSYYCTITNDKGSARSREVLVKGTDDMHADTLRTYFRSSCF